MSDSVMNYEDIISHDIQLRYDCCICCLEQNGPFVNISKCIHSGFLKTFPMPDFNPAISKVVCLKCHSVLKRINKFKMQVLECFSILHTKNPFQNKLDSKSDLIISKVENIDISENESKIDNSHIKIIPKTNTPNMAFQNTTNIQTAFNIINTNANSLQSLVSSNLKSITDTLLVVANEHLNFVPIRNTVLPETATSGAKLPDENNIFVQSSKRKISNEEKDLVQGKRLNLNTTAKNDYKTNTAYAKPDLLPGEIANINKKELLKKEIVAEELNIIEEEVIPLKNYYAIDTDVKINTIDVDTEIKQNGDKISKSCNKIHEKNVKTISINTKKVTTEFDNLNNETVLSMDIKEEKEEEVVIDHVYDTNILPDLKMEPDDPEADNAKSLKQIEAENDVTMDESASITSQTLTFKQLQQERLNKLKSKEYLKWPHRCINCIIGFQFKENLDDHNKRKHVMRESQVLCEICKQAINMEHMDKHISKHYNRLQCKECKKLFVLFDEAYYHCKTVHADRKNKQKMKLKLLKNIRGIKKRNKNIKTLKKTKPLTAISSPECNKVSSSDFAQLLTQNVII